jgi:uncharacterized membrane protein YidH (DUF202 family)
MGLALGPVKVMVRVLVRQHLQVPLLGVTVAPLALALVLRRPLAQTVFRRGPLLTAHPVGLYTSVILL